jgi:hypothetical protein
MPRLLSSPICGRQSLQPSTVALNLPSENLRRYAKSDSSTLDSQFKGFDATLFALLIVAAYGHCRLGCGFSSRVADENDRHALSGEGR